MSQTPAWFYIVGAGGAILAAIIASIVPQLMIAWRERRQHARREKQEAYARMLVAGETFSTGVRAAYRFVNRPEMHAEIMREILKELCEAEVGVWLAGTDEAMASARQITTLGTRMMELEMAGGGSSRDRAALRDELSTVRRQFIKGARQELHMPELEMLGDESRWEKVAERFSASDV